MWVKLNDTLVDLDGVTFIRRTTVEQEGCFIGDTHPKLDLIADEGHRFSVYFDTYEEQQAAFEELYQILTHNFRGVMIPDD